MIDDLKLNFQDSISQVMEQAQHYFEAEAVMLIGSFARGDQNELSDVDILLVTQSKKPLKKFYEDLNCGFNKKLVSLIRYPFHIFQKHWIEGSLFSYHLIKESKIHYSNDVVSEFMRSPFQLKDSFFFDIDHLGHRLDLYKNIDLFDKSAVYFSSQFFLHLKNIAMFKLAEMGQVTFNKWTAFDWLASNYCSDSKEQEVCELLKSAYLHIYKKREHCGDISTEDFDQILNFVRKVHADVQNTLR